LTDSQGEPISIQVYRGNTSGLKTFGQQVHKLKKELGCAGVTLVGDRGMIRTDQKAAAQQAGFHFITTLTKPQIQKLIADQVLQLELFEEHVHEVLGEDGRKVQDWLQLSVRQRRLVLTLDVPALQAAAQLDGCYVVETDLQPAQADARTIHDRYKDLAFVERDFRTLKTGHLEFRPWFVCTADNTQAHALTAMLALKVRRHLERAWWSLEVTMEEGLRELEKLCVMELLHPQSGQVVARQVPEPSARQQQLLAALKLELPVRVPEAAVTVGTRKKFHKVRRTLVK
jgi:hypothetical protein